MSFDDASMQIGKIFDVAGKTAFITGAGAGLGRAMALCLAKNGANVACFDQDTAGLEVTLSGIDKAGGKACGICGNVTVEAEVSDAVSATMDSFGRIDIAVANAGISDRSGARLHDACPDDWQNVVDVNLKGTYHVNRAALRYMLAQKSGKIINIASMWGLAAPAGLFPRPAYAASKGAIVNLTRELALEYAKDNIQINALCPGFFRTETRPRDQDHEDMMTKYTPMARIAASEEIAGSLLYLASSASDFVTGTSLVIDGGILAR